MGFKIGHLQCIFSRRGEFFGKDSLADVDKLVDLCGYLLAVQLRTYFDYLVYIP